MSKKFKLINKELIRFHEISLYLTINFSKELAAE